MSTVASRAARPVMLASAGIGVVGVSFGMARYGFGLLAPDIRRSFSLDNGAIGLLSAASYVAYIATTVTGAVFVVRVGPRAVVAAGGVCATVGMLVAASASTPAVLFTGLFVAGASAGLVFPPFSDVVADRLPRGSRGRVLSAINAGTGWGVALAAPIALAAGTSWRTAWLLFSLVAAGATIWALTVLPPFERGAGRGEGVRLEPRWFVCPRAAPLLVASLLIGFASSLGWTFGVEHLRTEGGLATAQGQVFLAVVGLASVGGSVSADAINRLGGRRTFYLTAAVEAVALLLLGFAPGSFGLTLLAALLFGLSYNAIVAVTVIWSARVFAERPSAGLAGVMVTQALGFLFGPPILGAVADHTGLAAMFAAVAALMLITTALAPRENLRDSGG